MKRSNKGFRKLRSHVFKERIVPDEFKEFVKEIILPRIILKGYKQKEKKEILVHVVHNLVLTGLIGACVCDTRRKTESGVRLRTEVWDAIIDAKLARTCLGSEKSRCRTRYRATGKLLDLRKYWELCLLMDLNLSRNSNMDIPSRYALIVLQTGKIDPITGKPLPKNERKKLISIKNFIEKTAQPGIDGKPDPRAVQNGLNYIRGIEDTIEKINQSNLQHTWVAYGTDPETGRTHAFQPNVCLRQIHVGKPFRATRLYSWGPLSGQNLSKKQRRLILIDGEKVTELDFSGMITRMLYNLQHLDPDHKKDIYKPEQIFPKFYGFTNVSKVKKKIIRGFVKKATNICWNVGKRSAANSSLGKLLANHKERDFLKKVIYKTEGFKELSHIIDRIIEVHPDLKRWFFTQVGVEKMTSEGRIMLQILRTFTEAGKPVLAIHDSIVCRESDYDFARKTMRDSYKWLTLFPPVIHRVY